MTGWRSVPPGFVFREAKCERGLALLREAADLWARDGREALSEQVVVSVFVRLLTSAEEYRPLQLRGSTSSGETPALPVRPLQDWAPSARSPSEEIACASTHLGHSDVCSLSEACLALIAEAATEWALGDPEQPQTEAVFRHLARLLDSRGLIPWWGEAPGARP
jgi:hypothetical protein